MVHIADDSMSNVPIAYIKVQIAVRQWIAGRLNPRKWDPKFKEGNNPADNRFGHKLPDWITKTSDTDDNDYQP